MSKRVSRFGSNVTADVARRKKEGSAYGYLKLPQGVNVFKESKGTIEIDIIPYIVTDEHHMDGNPKFPDAANPGNPWYKKPFYTHRSVGPENQTIVCPKTIGKKCPVCEHRASQQQKGVEKDEMIAKAQLRNLYVVIPKGHKEFEEKMHIWDISNALFQKVLDEELNENPDAGIFPDPEEGATLSVRFSEETFAKNKYFEAKRVDFEERKKPYAEDIMEKAPNLDEVLTILTYKEIEKMFLEIPDEEEEEDDPAPMKAKKAELEEDEPKPSRFAKRKRDEDEEVEEEAPKEEEEESHPFKKKKVVKDEEEEESKPFKRKKPEPVVEVPKEKEAEEEAPPIRRRAEKEEPSVKKAKVESNGKCPAGHTYADDWDMYEDCDECPVFKACGIQHEKK